mmetsp:Transcript_37814/g.95641  ORF Transcript_37814/g.95641 Transcript_37814/m.95641 type:complete len:208 (+) Transcript_37814:165-788(+)
MHPGHPTSPQGSPPRTSLPPWHYSSTTVQHYKLPILGSSCLRVGHASIQVLADQGRQRTQAVPHAREHDAVHDLQQEHVAQRVDQHQREQHAGDGGRGGRAAVPDGRTDLVQHAVHVGQHDGKQVLIHGHTGQHEVRDLARHAHEAAHHRGQPEVGLVGPQRAQRGGCQAVDEHVGHGAQRAQQHNNQGGCREHRAPPCACAAAQGC